MIRRLFRSQLRINMASGVVTTVVNTIVMAVGYPIYLHFLGYEKYGLWLVLSVVLTFAQLGNLGIGPAVTKLVAEDYGRGDVEGIQHYVTTALALLCLSGLVVLMVILVFKGAIIAAFKLSDADARIVASLMPYIGILSIYVFIVQVLDATLSGLGRMDLSNYIQTAARVLAVTASAVLLYRGFGILSLLVGNMVSYIFNHLLSLFYIRRGARIRLCQVGNWDISHCRRLLRFGGGVFGGSLISMLFDPFNKLMLSRYAGVSAIPVYEIAFRGSMHIRSLIEAGLRALMPEISRLNGITTQGARNRIIHIYRRAMGLILSTGIPLYATLAVFATVLLKLWLGDSFEETLPRVFRIMLAGTFLSLLGVPAFYTLMGVGRVRSCFTSQAVSSFAHVALVIMIATFSGTVLAQNVAYAMVVAISGSTLFLTWQLRRWSLAAQTIPGRLGEQDRPLDSLPTLYTHIHRSVR